MEILIDAKNLVLGRVAAYAAKQALLGNNVKIVNCRDAVITGSRKFVLSKYNQRLQRGNTSNGPFIPKQTDRFVRRTVRGMLPYKMPKGRDALKRVMCYAGTPEDFSGKKPVILQEADVSKTGKLNYVAVSDICKMIGGKL